MFLAAIRIRFARSLLVFGLLVLMAASAQAGQQQAAVAILVYHRFDALKAGDMTVKTSDFESQLDWLTSRKYNIVPLPSVVPSLGAIASPYPSPAVAITVDDGHVSVYTQLYPIILRRHLPVTLFIYPSAISNASYALTWDELATMQRSGLVDIQSHTYWHPNFRQERMKRAPADYQLFVDFQLTRSKRILEQRLGIQVTTLAWPYGIHDRQLEAAAAHAGYGAAFAFAGGLFEPGDDLFAIPRIPVSGRAGGDGLGSLLSRPR